MAKARQQYFADETTLQKESREFAITPDIINKLDSIETGAQVNVIETVKVNGTALVPDANKAVNVEVPDVIDNLFSTSTDDALSAKQGKVLYDYLQNIASRGRYLSNWNCVTGLAVTNPSENPYPYKAGDYYSVSNVAAIGGTNYRPDGTQYIIGQASTTVETELVSVSDFYLYDGTNWLLLANSARQIAVDSSLSTTSTNPVENRVVTNAINGKQDTLVAGTNIQIASDGVTISATDTTYSAGNNISIDANNEISAIDTTYTAGANIQISNQNVISATDTVYAAGTNVQINNNVISATDTTYTAGTGISIDSNNVISNTQTSAEWGNITGTLSNQIDLQDALDAKQDDMVVLSYGHSTWQDFLNAYNKNAIVYCKASSNSNPGTGNQSRMAFMAYVTNPSSPTSVEFQYYRSVATHSASQQGDQVFVYTLSNTSGGTWAVTTRETSSKIVAGTNMSSSYSSGELTLNASAQYDNTAYGTSWDGVTNKAPTKNAIYDKISAMDTTIAGKQDTLIAGTGINIGSANGRQGPSPDGFHIPSIDEWSGVRTIMNGLSPVTVGGDGWRMFLHMPFAGGRDNSDASLYNQGDYGYYWSSSPDSEGTNAYFLGIDTGYTGTSNNKRAFGYSVRCFKDEYVTPDSDWTVVFGTLGSAGIFWNQSEGLISITDGSTGYTIQDKNLGATTVYGEYDTLSEANCGKYYQWGNNYGFPSTGTISNTSSTQVDASGYGPGNYYSSDTFITFNGDWSLVQNDDLWGDTTGIIENVISNTGVTSVNGQTGDITISGAVWGNITGTLSDQTDLNNALGGKQDTLTAGDNITITSNTISAIDTTYAAGDNITIRNVCSKDTRGPCPEGFHIPTDTEIQALNTAMQALTLTTYTDWVTYLKMPLPGVLANFSGSIADSGTRGRYWTSVGDSTGFAFYLNLSSAGVNVYGSLINSYGFSIRPFKDTVETPDSGWTVLYQGSGSAGIYHNSTLGLISISSDGTNFTTISDKNVGATTVYNSGDALTSDNCGGLFQWGNNNAFSISGATTTSSTQVDASNYGPGNYYSSDTFITTSGQTSWNSPINKNLWGGESQGTSCMPTIFAAGTNYIAGTGISITNGTIANTGVTSVNGQTGAITVSSPITALTTNTSSYDFQGNIDPGTYVLTSSGKYLEIASSTYVQVNGSNFKTSGRGLWLYNDTDDWTYIDGKYIIRMYGTGTSYSVLPFEINVQAFTISSTSDTSIGYQVLTTSQQPIVVYNNCAYILKSSSTTGSSMSYTKTMVFESPADISGTTISYNTLTFVLTHSLITDTVTITAGSASATAGDMNYSDFNWASKTGATITLDLASTISPSADFTVNAPSTIKDGQTYILRVNNEGTAYEMTLGTNVTNPYDTDITLTDDGVDQFVFLAINGELELQPEGGGGGGGDYQLAPNSPLKPKYRWYGTQAQYDALTQYYTDEEGDTVYFTI